MASIIEIGSELESLDSYNSYKCEPENCSLLLGSMQHNSLSVLHINIRSIGKNFDQLRVLLVTIKVTCHVIVLTECWLPSCPNLPFLEGYTSYSTTNPRNQNAGVTIYVKSSLDHTVFEPNLKCADCLICTIDKKTAVIAIYRSPSFNLQVHMNNFLESLDSILINLKHYNNISLVGDLNIDIKPLNEDVFSEDYLFLNASHAISPTHTFPTKLNKCYDHVLLKSKFTFTTLVINSHITDHLPTLLCLQLKLNISKNSKLKYITDFVGIQHELAKTDFSHILLIEDANRATDTLVSTLSNIIANYTKSSTTTPRKNKILKPWITPGLLRCIRNRDRLHKKTRSNPNNQIIKITYTRYRNFCNCLLRKLKVLYEKDLLLKSKYNPKATWNTIKKITYTEKSRNPPEELLKLATDIQTSLNTVNNYFVEIGKNLASEIRAGSEHEVPISQYIRDTNNQNSMAILETDESEIESVIMSLRTDSSTGCDGISPSILKSNKKCLIPIITHLCNISLRSGVFPKAFKKALVHPIHKSGDKSDIANYRPISILTTLSKILEKLLNKRLIKFLNKNNIISNNQYGFRAGISTEDAVVGLVDHITMKLDQGLKCVGIFLDLQKAFDTVYIPALLSKLQNVGVRGVAHDIYSDYLSDRCQRVLLNGHTSDEARIEYGVPQGSILGPTLFLLYINQLCDMCLPNCKIFTYADDTAVVIHGQNWAEIKFIAESNLTIINNWLMQNRLTLNLSKTHFIPFSIRNNTQPPPNYVLFVHSHCNQITNCNCSPLSQTSNIKYLGVHIDSNLNWSIQINNLTTRIRRLIHIFKTLRKSADSETLNMVYSALCESVLTYCVPVWGCATKTSFIKIERAQRAVLKVKNFKTFRSPTSELYSTSGVMTVRQLFVLRLILRKHLMVPLRDPSKRIKIRVCPVPPHRTTFSTRQCIVSSAIIYNCVNNVLNLLPLNRHEVKRRLTNFLLTLDYDETEKLLPYSL